MSNGRFAYLGPEGTYSELALRQFVSPQASAACPSISEVFRRTAEGQCDAGLVPIENMIQGPITETLDELFRYRGKLVIEYSFLLRIDHALGVLPCSPGEEAITAIYSHVQALQQCASFLQTRFPAAQRTATESTVSAVQLLKEKGLGSAAVIAPKQTLLEQGCVVLCDGISDVAGNQTRFIVIRKVEHAPVVSRTNPESDGSYVTSLVVNPGRDRQGILYELLQLISIESGLNLVSIHSRPDAKGGFVFYFDVEGVAHEKQMEHALAALRAYCARETGHTAELIVFGSYRRLPFYRPAFQTIGIIGGQGEMGRCFSQLLANAGYTVLISDQTGGLLLTELVAKSDVLLLSVPMTAIPEVAAQLSSVVREGQLVVENCSIKASSLPLLLKRLPGGVEVLGIHTMFGGQVQSLKGENIIVTSTERSGRLAQAFEDLLYKHGANISRVEPKAHDESVAYVQSLVHLVLIALAETMRERFPAADSLSIFSTPNSRALHTAMERIVGQKEDLLRDIQALNPHAAPMRDHFLKVLSRLVSSLDAGKFGDYVQSAQRSRSYLREG